MTAGDGDGDGRRRLGVAVAASLTVLAAAPAIGQIRGAIQDAFPDQYRLILIGVVLAAVVAGLAWAVRTIRDRRGLRYGLIAGAVATGTIYSMAMATGNANVDAVERFHFVEYGLLTLLFHRALSRIGAGGRARLPSVMLPVMAVFIVGTLDEAIQWFVPVRVGEWRDVLLNAAAIGCGLLFAIGLDPPVRLKADTTYEVRLKADTTHANRSVRLQADRLLVAMTILTLVTFGAFFYAVHIGHEVRDPDIGSFRSRYRADELLALAADRFQRWKVDPPLTLRRFSREDQYLAEAVWHIQRRNEMEGEGGVWATWKENLILEKYFAPVLEFRTYATPDGARWPPEQRAAVAAAAEQASSEEARTEAGTGIARRPFVSDAAPVPIYTWFDR